MAFATGSIISDKISPRGVVKPLAALTIGLDLGKPFVSTFLCVLAVALNTGGSHAHEETFSWHLAAFLTPLFQPKLKIFANPLECDLITFRASPN